MQYTINDIRTYYVLVFLVKIGVIPFGLGDFVGCICHRAILTSLTLKSSSSSVFISGDILVLTASKLGSKELDC